MSEPPTDPNIILPNFTQPSPSPSPSPSPELAVESHGLSDKGMVRGNNEDDFLIADLCRTLVVRQAKIPQTGPWLSTDAGCLFVVADGMGGHQAGHLASLFAVGAVQAFLLDSFRWAIRRDGPDEGSPLVEFEAALRSADARLADEVARHPDWAGMGTTMTLAFAAGRKLFVAHAGDSRCYLFRDGQLTQVTRDHTVVAELVRQGQITPEEACRHPYRHVITNYLGGDSSHRLHVELHEVKLQDGDVAVLCSDGLTAMLTDDFVADILRNHPDPRGACERLVAEANGHGGRDNVTVIVARFGGG
jgi:serine/threonine protein phosphatase PrpC